MKFTTKEPIYIYFNIFVFIFRPRRFLFFFLGGIVMFIQPSNNNTLLKEILDDIKCIKKDIASIKSEMNIAKRNLEIVSDHTIKFDEHIDFIENKFNWYKGTLDFLQYFVSFKFLGSTQNQFFIE